jgi:pimeloyl-ACP methyl ester carboxylesterase
LSEVKPVVFKNRKGLRLFGIHHVPEQCRNGIAIIILSPGIKNRVGPHRLYVKMARRYTGMGFQVLRVDPEGLGDSEGDIDETLTADLYGSIEAGRLVEDTLCAMDWMEKEHGIKKFILTGLCGGAITALLAGARDERVIHVVGLGITISLKGSATDPYRYMSRGQLGQVRKSYISKFARGSAWLRFFTFRSDYRLIFKSFILLLKDAVRSFLKRKSEEPQITPIAKNNLNPLFPEAFRCFATTRRVLLIFGGADRLHWEFEEKYLQNYTQEFRKFDKNIDIHVIENANHILSITEWQYEMLGIVTSGLERIVAPARPPHVP